MPLQPRYVTDRATLYQGDALGVIRELPTASVDAVVTDPPYSSGGQFRSDRSQDVHAKYVQTDSASGHSLAAFAGDNRDQRGYAYWCVLWLAEALRVARPGAICALFTDWRQLPTTTDALQAGGWVWRGILPWHKPNGRQTQGRPANNCEYIAWGTAGPRSLGRHETLPGFVQCNVSHDRHHITEKPLQVMRTLVHVAPADGLILDPFTGSGSTGVAAINEGRRFVGVEVLGEHCTNAARRLDDAQLRADPEASMLPLERLCLSEGAGASS